MDIARHIQSSILPKNMELPGYEVAALMETATEVGGDSYEILATPLGNFIGIGDVSGHGLASGITALIELAAFHGAVQTHMKYSQEPAPQVIYDIINKVLCEINRDRIGSDKFMTKILMVERNGKIIHAGTHEIGLFYKTSDKKVHHLNEMVSHTGFLGLSEYIDSSESVGEFSMESGDVLLLYTDGLIEAKNREDFQFDLSRAEAILKRHCALPVKELLSTLRDTVFKWAQDGDLARHSGRLADDLTLVAIRRK